MYAVPGKIDSPNSEGCNHLIKTNKAQLLDSVEDLAMDLGWESPSTTNEPIREIFIDLNEDEKVLVDILKESNKLRIDELSLKISLPSSKIASNLLALEFKGIVRTLPGKIYQLVH